MRGLFNKHFWKFLVGFLAIMTAGFFLLVWANIYHNGQNSEQSKAEKYLKDLEKAYKNDTYGGKTPEETLQLFIDALKKGNIDLAAKYFVIEKQKEWRENLGKIKNANKIGELVQNLGLAKINEKSSNSETAVFEFSKYFSGGSVEIQGQKFNVDAGDVLQTINLGKIPNGIWKILDL